MKDYGFKKKRKAAKAFRKKRTREWSLLPLLKRGGQLLFLALTFSATAVALQFGWTTLQTAPFFSLSEIRIDGLAKVSRGEILAKGGIGEKTNIFSFDIEEVGRRIEELPWVRRVTLERRFPNSLYIRVEERAPLALVNLGELYYVDDDGYLFAKAESAPGWDFPVLSGIDRARLLEGEKETFGRLEKGLAFTRLLKERQGEISWKTVSEIVLDPEGGITLYPVVKGIPIFLGEGEVEARLARAEKTLADLGSKGIAARRIEADYDDRVLVKVAI